MSKVKVATYADTCKSIEEHLRTIEGRDVVVRLGGTMPYEKYPVQINDARGVELSIDKYRFTQICSKPLQTAFIYNVNSLTHFSHSFGGDLFNRPPVNGGNHRIILKPLSSSAGKGIQIFEYTRGRLFNEQQEPAPMDLVLSSYLTSSGPFIVQPFIQATSEYRVHVSSLGNYKMTKKVKKNPEDKFITRSNHTVLDINNTDKPRLMKEIISNCKETLGRMGMDILCFDVLYDSSDKDNHDFFIIESNTGPELIGSTKEWYINEINQIIQRKIQ
jgi:glutathione synthase/RimK-type ligase-like ATP-grasp enzyme